MNAIRRFFGGGDEPDRDASAPQEGAADQCEHDGVTCLEALERIYEFMDGELGEADHAEIEDHFQKCAACYPHLAMEENFRRKVCEALRRGECPDALRRRVMTILEGEAGS